MTYPRQDKHTNPLPTRRESTFAYWEIPLGVGTKALTRWDTLVYLLGAVIRNYKASNEYHTALLLGDWRSSLGFRIREAPHWTLEIDEPTWAALSRGLRAAGTAPASSMYQWLNQHKEARFNIALDHGR